MNITKLIVELLQKGQKVEIPEIGTFDSVEQAPHHDPVTRIYYPATRSVVYNPSFAGDDSIVKIIAQQECVSEDVARQMWRNYVDALKDKLKQTGEHRLEDLGTITKVGESYGFDMSEGVVIEAGSSNETPLEEVKVYDHSNSEDPFSQFEEEPEVTVVKKVEEPVPEPKPEPKPEPVVEEAPEPEPEPAVEETPASNVPNEWMESLKQLDELPKSKDQLKAEAKAEKERLKAEAKAEKERERLRRRAEKDSEQEERMAIQQREAEQRKEAEDRRRAQEELRKAEERAEQDRKKAEREARESMKRAEEKAEEERIKAEKKAAVLAAVAASQAARNEAAGSTTQAQPEVKKDYKEALAEMEMQEQESLDEHVRVDKDAARKLKEEERMRKAAEKIAAKEAARQMKEERKKKSKEVVEKLNSEYEQEKKGRVKRILLIAVILLVVAGAAFIVLKGFNNRTKDNHDVVVVKNGKHLNVPAYTSFSFNPDMIVYSEREIGRNSDRVCNTLAEYINNFLASRDYRNARVPMMDRVRQYAEERLEGLLGPRFAVQRFIPYDDYVYAHVEPWLKKDYANYARHIVQGELMYTSSLDEILNQLVEELGLQPGESQYSAAEVQQVKASEQAAVTKKPKKQVEKESLAYVYVEKNSKQGFDVIAGFYLNKGTAAKMTARLHEQGCDAYIIEKNDMYYVSMGSAPTRTKAEALYNHIKSWYDGDIVIKEL